VPMILMPFFMQSFRQFQGRLSAQLDDDPFRFFQLDDLPEMFPVDRLE